MNAYLKSECRFLVASVVAIGLMFFAPVTFAADKVTVMLGASWPPYNIWNVIKEKGLSPDLDLEIIELNDPIQAHGQLAVGEADVLMNTIDYAPIIVEQNLPIKLVAYSNLDYGSSQIIAAPGIESQADLRGLKVGALDGYISQLMMVLWLKEGGVGTNEVEFVNLSPEEAGAAMLSGDIKAAYTWDPWAGQILASLEGSTRIAHAKQDFWLETALLSDAMFMNLDFLNNQRDTAIKVMRAYYDGLAWWRKNVEEGNEIIARASGYPIEDVAWILGSDGTTQDGALRMYDFLEAAQFCGVAPGEPPHGQRNGQIYRTFSLTNEAWTAVGLNEGMVPAARTIDCSLLRELYETSYAGEHDPNY